jgi:hypothetical protein
MNVRCVEDLFGEEELEKAYIGYQCLKMVSLVRVFLGNRWQAYTISRIVKSK